MTRPVKICHLLLVDGTTKEVQQVQKALISVKDKINKANDFDIEFLITNQDVQLRDVNELAEFFNGLQERQEKLRKEKLEQMYPSKEEEK